MSEAPEVAPVVDIGPLEERLDAAIVALEDASNFAKSGPALRVVDVAHRVMVQPGGVARGFARAEDHRRLRPRRERRRHPRRSLAPVLPEPLPAVGRRAAAAQARSVQAQLRDVDREETGDDRVGLDDGRERRRGGRVDDASFSRAPGRGRALPGARAVVVVARVARVAGVVRVALAAVLGL